MLIQSIDAHGLEIVPEGGLDSPLPAAIDLERLSNPLPLAQPHAIEPLRRLPRVMGQRRLLQSLQRGQLATGPFALTACRFQPLFELQLFRPERMHALQGRRQRLGQLLAGAAGLRLLLAQQTQVLVEFLRRERVALQRETVSLRREPPQLVLELLDARPLDLSRLVGGAQGPVEFFPAPLPVLQLFLGRDEGFRGGLLGEPHLFQFRLEAGNLLPQPGHLEFIALDMGAQVIESRDRLAKICALALTQLA